MTAEQWAAAAMLSGLTILGKEDLEFRDEAISALGHHILDTGDFESVKEWTPGRVVREKNGFRAITTTVLEEIK